MKNVKEVAEEMVNVEDRLLFKESAIQKKRVEVEIPFSSLKTNKSYFVEDPLGGYCDYYLIQRHSRNMLVVLPLWANTIENLVFSDVYHTGEGEAFISGFCVKLTKEQKKIAESFDEALSFDEEPTILNFFEYITSPIHEKKEKKYLKLSEETLFYFTK